MKVDTTTRLLIFAVSVGLTLSFPAAASELTQMHDTQTNIKIPANISIRVESDFLGLGVVACAGCTCGAR